MISDDDVATETSAAPTTPTAATAPQRPSGLNGVLAALALVTTVAALLGLAWTGERDDARALDDDAALERDARLVAAQFGEAFFTYDFRDVEASTDAVLGLVTDGYAAAFQENRLPGLGELFANTQLSTTATAGEVFLGEPSGDRVRAVVVLDVVAAGDLESRTLDDLSLVLDLERVDGEWKVGAVSLPQTRILGPDGQPVAGGAAATTSTTTTTTTPPG